MLSRKRLFLGAAILLLLAGVQAQRSATISSQSLCVISGSTVKIPCSFTEPYGFGVTLKEWYRLFGQELRVLNWDPRYAGRVSVSPWEFSCELTMTDVSVNDSGFYNLRYKTHNGDWVSASSGVHLTVTDLKVQVPDQYQWRKTLSCITTCALSNNPTYIWYKNKQRVYNEYSKDLYRYGSKDAGSYSCAVRGHEDLRSPAVCVFGVNCWSVTYSSLKICSLIGSSVDIYSYYTFPDNHDVRNSFWFIKQHIYGEPMDLRENEAYQGRVQYTQSSQNKCSMRITNLRETDAQTYRFRLDTVWDKLIGEPGVLLSVTDLKVKVSVWSSWSGTLSCITTCALSNNPTYIWYKNGQKVFYQDEKDLHRYSSKDAGSYSCAVKGHEYRRSPPVCVFGVNCWSVTYSSQEVCSLIGSSVDIHSYYTFPDNHDVRESFWFIKQKTVDMTEDDEYQGRVQYTHSSQNNCSLRITNLRESDAQTYRFRFDTNNGDYSGEPGVSLSVTGLKITVSNWYSWSKKLNCVTSCTLSNNPIYIWYKNGQPVTNEYSNELDLFDNTDEDSYSCSIRGHEELRSPAVYSPKNTNAVVLSGETLEGGSVTLSCSSDANPC
ncbi:uncharacterized protein LOC124379963 [Silurus meridionalis]|uniref:uncharacterized protein LOC124379963 n=1 Tax=Silurus meridionalis TaxID=175797 RepID=UPI001EE9BF50|nr:uncharacterized protein LOC124379963 [Silurus meridionalis]